MQTNHRFNTTGSSSESKISMDFLTCGLINGPFTILNIMANVFFIFCMACPLYGERIKQPLKLLLGSLICCAITFSISVVVQFSSQTTAGSMNLMLASYVVFVCSLSTSMSSSAWLNFFYYTQIVPTQRALFIWIKKNIKPFIYCIWLVEKIFSLFDVGAQLIDYFLLNNPISYGFSYNVTMYNDKIYLQRALSELQTNVYAIAVCIVKAHFIFCLCVMVMSSGSTVVYLFRHMRRMVANGQPYSCPQFRSQVRVTVTGILQGVLYVFCAMWTVHKYFSQSFLISTVSSYSCIHFTVINFYMAGITFTLGAGQGVFRQRAADIWLRAGQWCKAPEIQQSEQGG